MAKPPTKLQALQRDGTSQAGRQQAALDPDYVSVDERSPRDLLAFAWDYAKELKYFDEDERAAGDWGAFLGLDRELDLDLEEDREAFLAYLDEADAFMAAPEGFAPDRAWRFKRPHFALFLAFLQLLGHARNELNTLTRRHLDFYYRHVLRMTKKAAVPDRVNVMLEPAAGVEQVELPAGSLFAAGQDDLGQERVYRSDRGIVVNRARIARLSSVFADRRITGIREGRELAKGTTKDRFLEMLSIALGDPLPGDPLPPYAEDRPVDFALLENLRGVVDFAPDSLGLKHFELRELILMKRRRDGADDEWREINRLLEKAGRKRQAGFELSPEDPRDFDANLAKALDGTPDFAGITQVETVYDLHEEYRKGQREEVMKAIRERLFFDDPADFDSMMKIKGRIDDDWAAVNRILEKAGQRKRGNSSYRLVPEAARPGSFDPADFEANFNAAVGPPDFDPPNFGSLREGTEIADLDEYDAAVRRVEDHYYMSAESFSFVMSAAVKPTQRATDREWSKVYGLLAEAHRDKVYADRRERLDKAREAAASEAEGFKAIVCIALGEDPEDADSSYLNRLKEFVTKEGDYDFLRTLQGRLGEGGIAGEDWGRAIRIVEIAQRVREELPEPVARKEEWLNLYPHEDATAVGVTLGVEAEQDSERWKTFGRARPAASPDDPPQAALGWAVSSPLLSLSEGRRKLVLTLGFPGDHYDAKEIDPLLPSKPVSSGEDSGPFRVQISSEKGWIEADSLEVEAGDYKALSGSDRRIDQPLKGLQFTLTFNESADPIAPLPAEEARIESPWPVLKLMLRQVWDRDSRRFVTRYAPFEHLELASVHMRVRVGSSDGVQAPGLTTIRIQNDEGTLDAKKPFEPFGVGPAVGSRFFLGHTELVHKRLDSLTFNMEWMGGPENLAAHYRNYEIGKAFKGDFKTRISLIDRHIEYPLDEAASLFAKGNAASGHSIEVPSVTKAMGKTYERSIEAPTDEDLQNWGRYLQWELTGPDFQHQAYPSVAARKSAELAWEIARNPRPDDPAALAAAYEVKPPYTPKMKSLSLDYSASLEVDLRTYHRGPETDQIFHIHPFGYNEIWPDPAGLESPFLPQYDHEGELYIGITGIRNSSPPRNLSLLFQMAEGSADPDLEPVPVEWSYLSDDRWISLGDGNVRLDTTRGLINSGIIEFELEPAEPSTRLPAGYYWIRGAIGHNGNSVCDTVAIHTQAVSATFVDNDNAPEHYGQPLPAETIAGLAAPLPGISAVKQPYTSYGGKEEEQDQGFYTRISERLRHRQRALTIWDYERLVLERFPQIYKVKCLPAGFAERPEDIGRVEVIVIPDIRNRLPFNPFEPKAPADLIADIESYLADKIPTCASVRVRNPHYVPVKLRFGVRFKPGRDEGFYIQKLNEELNRFLSPWAYEEAADIVIGGRIYANSIVNFVDQRDYVDYIATIKLFSSEDGRSFDLARESESEGYFVTTDRPDGVLVAARRHEIDVIAEEGYEEESFTGINYMKVELDFVVD